MIKPPPLLSSLSFLIAVYCCMLGVFIDFVSFDSCIVIMSADSSLMRSFSSSILFLTPFMFIWMICSGFVSGFVLLLC